MVARIMVRSDEGWLGGRHGRSDQLRGLRIYSPLKVGLVYGRIILQLLVPGDLYISILVTPSKAKTRSYAHAWHSAPLQPLPLAAIARKVNGTAATRGEGQLASHNFYMRDMNKIYKMTLYNFIHGRCL